ncbi:MAG: FAD-dependent oxidoreductase [Gammaproteobacteria bacterium]|nr:FAD-dependent oxidoreductase [Gammaproteobacteria bacterium]
MSVARSLDTITSAEHPMKHVVVVGGGPIGLLVACKLKQLGLDSVTLIDHRAGTYVRSSDYVNDVFHVFTQMLGLPVTASKGRHIKDIERELYKHAASLGVTILNCKFKDFDGLGLKIQDSEEKTSTIPCDIVIDCTGNTRAVIHKVNEHFPQDPKFTLSPNVILTNPYHMHARIKIDNNYYFPPREYQNVNSIDYIKKVESLRRLGWNEFVLPYHYVNKFPSKNKANLYTEAPANLLPEQYQEWAQAVFELNNIMHSPFELHKDSKKYPNKKTISYFKMQPQKVEPAYFYQEKKYPIVFHAGDATCEGVYVMGIGLIYGTQRVTCFLNSLIIKDNEIVQIKIQDYQKSLTEMLKRHSNSVNKTVKEVLNERLIKDYTQLHEKYSDAYKKATTPQDKKVIESELELINIDYKEQLYQNAIRLMTPIKQEDTGFDLSKINAKIDIDTIFKSLNDAIQLPPLTLPADKVKIRLALLDMAKRCQLLAKNLYEQAKYGLAEKYFSMSLNIYSTYFTDKYREEVSVLYSNLMILKNKRNDFISVLKLADKALEVSLTLPEGSLKDKKIAQITYQKTKAILQKTAALTKQVESHHSEIEKLTSQAEEGMNLLRENKYSKGAAVEILKKELNDLKKISTDSAQNKKI